MPVLLLLLLLGVLGYLYWRRRTTTLTRNCRWRADRTRDENGRHFYRCVACGAETRTDGDGPPLHCHAPSAGRQGGPGAG